MTHPFSLMVLTYAALALLVGGGSQATADMIYDNSAFWDHHQSVSPWAPRNTTTFGQTFVAASGTVLHDFTFYLYAIQHPTVTFEADVFSWTGPLVGHGGHATGPALFTQSGLTYNSNNTFQAVTVNTGNTLLGSGNQYVALFTFSDATSQLMNKGDNKIFIDWATTDPDVPVNDGGGGFVYLNNGSDYGALNTALWNTSLAPDLQSVWGAHFTTANPVPEPSTLAQLGGLGGMCLLIGAYRRLRTTVV